MDFDQFDTEELDQLDINALREGILQLIGDRHKKREAQERIQEKIRALNSELAARQVEGDELAEELEDVRAENTRKLKSININTDSGSGDIMAMDFDQLEEIRQILFGELQKLAGSKFDPSEDITKIEPDETELMVEKDDPSKEQSIVDTVLVLFHPTEDPEGQVFTQTYRTTESTTVKQLLRDACKYWAVSTEEFVLKTVGYNAKVQGSMQVTQVFRPGELSQLVLMKKNPKNVFVSEAEKRACLPKKGRGAAGAAGAVEKKDKDEDDAPVYKKEKPFLEQLNQFPGLRETLLQKDLSVYHEPEKCRDCFGFFLLVLFSFLLIYLGRDFQKEFFLAEDVRAILVDKLQLYRIATSDDYFSYLRSLELELTNNDLFNHFSVPVGYLRLRQQRVLDAIRGGELLDDAAEVCVLKRGRIARQGVCPARYVNEDSADKGNTITNEWIAYANFDNGVTGVTNYNTSLLLTSKAGNESLITTADYNRFLQSEPAEYFRDLLYHGHADSLSTTSANTHTLALQQSTSVVENLLNLNPTLKAQWELRGRRRRTQTTGTTSEYIYVDPPWLSMFLTGGASPTGSLPTTTSLSKRKEDPFTFVSAEQAVASSADVDYEATDGLVQSSYDASGYRIDWHMDFLHETMRYDLTDLQRVQWIDTFTRFLTVNFVLYNPSDDYFINVQLKTEFPATSSAINSESITPMRPNVMETEDELGTMWPLELTRLLVTILFVGCYIIPKHIGIFWAPPANRAVVWAIKGPELKLQHKFADYIFSFRGALDFAILIVTFILFITKYTTFANLKTYNDTTASTETTTTTIAASGTTAAATSTDAMTEQVDSSTTVLYHLLKGDYVQLPADSYKQLAVYEGLFFALALLRLTGNLTSLTRHGYIALETLKTSLAFVTPWFLALLLPMFFIIALLFHVAFGSTWVNYRTYFQSVSTSFRLFKGRMSNGEELKFYNTDRLMTAIVMLFLFTFVQQLITFLTLAVILHFYQFYYTILGGYSYPNVLEVAQAHGQDPRRNLANTIKYSEKYQWNIIQWAEYACVPPLAEKIRLMVEKKPKTVEEELLEESQALKDGDVEKESDEQSAKSGEIEINSPVKPAVA
ncbi:unnamed protein product [Amoebophrya sp. A120]|nr:unnamed protein product [Amoebophrya sp. A120]|eukprot:GSA120T00010174001.1